MYPSATVTFSPHGYLHGYRAEERERLHRQARFLEPMVHDRLPFRRRTRLLEVGCGVGAQTEILLRHFPDVHVTGIDINDEQLAEARRFLGTVPWATGRFEIRKMDAEKLEFDPESFDGAFLCWVLEHVPSPPRVLGEVRRVLAPGAPIVCSEVLNATFFIDPYSPDTLRYWMAYNDRQIELGGDPFVGRQARQPALVGRLPRRDDRREDVPPRQPRPRRACRVPGLLDGAPPVGGAGAARGGEGARRTSWTE